MSRGALPPDLPALLAYLRGERARLDLAPDRRRALADWLAALGGESPAAAAPAPTPAPASARQAVAPEDWVLLHTDGASRGNPGLAAAGIVIYGPGAGANRPELHREGVALGVLTNNQAEYRALLLGLAAASRLGARRVELAMDSELIVRQLEGRYKVKNAGLKPLYEEARLALTRFVAWRARHVPRAENAVADALANEALDSL